MEDKARGNGSQPAACAPVTSAARRKTITALMPLCSEYAQALARTGLRSEECKNHHVFQPRHTLDSEGYSTAATCQFCF